MGTLYGLVDADIESRGMGQSGVDVVLSPAAKKVFPLGIECKNQESLNVHRIFAKHYEQYKDEYLFPILVHSKNHSRTLVTMDSTSFLELLATWVAEREKSETNISTQKAA
jgi:hypothetical protein